MFSTGAPWVGPLAATLTVAASSRCVSQIPVCAVAGQPPLVEHGEGREAAAQLGDLGAKAAARPGDWWTVRLVRGGDSARAEDVRPAVRCGRGSAPGDAVGQLGEGQI